MTFWPFNDPWFSSRYEIQTISDSEIKVIQTPFHPFLPKSIIFPKIFPFSIKNGQVRAWFDRKQFFTNKWPFFGDSDFGDIVTLVT